jgi:hypothetical protein
MGLEERVKFAEVLKIHLNFGTPKNQRFFGGSLYEKSSFIMRQSTAKW